MRQCWRVLCPVARACFQDKGNDWSLLSSLPQHGPCGKCVVAAIFLRNGDRHLDGVAILVLLVRCSGTQWYAVVRVFLEYMDIVALKFAEAPGPASCRGGWQWRSLRPLALPSFHAVHQALSLGPCTVTVNGARLPAKTQGRTVDCSFNL